MTSETSQHDWFAERIATYLTDGMSGEERSEFESHAAGCADCAGKLAWAKGEDESLRELFAEIAPSAGFEDRVIQRLRRSGWKMPGLMGSIRLRPAVVKAATAAAAIVLVGGLGYWTVQVMQERRVAGAGQTIEPPMMAWADVPPPVAQRTATTLSYSYASPNSNRTQLGSGYRMVTGLEPTFAVAADINPGEQHEKEGQNVLPGDNLRVTRSSIAAGSPLAENKDLDGMASESTPAPTAAYSYDSELKAPAPGAANSYQPADVLASKSVGDLQSVPQQTAASPSPTNAPVSRQGGLFGVTGGFGGAGAGGGGGGGNGNAEANQTAQPESGRKIIRNGEMSFEVDSFDSAFVQISKIAAEEGGFVSDTDSNKLDNGKMSGAVTVRVPPEHLDTLVLKLRALGDLKAQQITSEDITRQYTDLQSELRAAQAMEDRLLEIIKTSKGTVRELLAAEDQVGVWREKVEQVTGQINYFNNQVSLSTLRISLMERDFRQAALASEQEVVDMGIETADVEKARDQAMAALDGVKARIVHAELKKLDAGQFQATIMADVSPDAAGPIIDQLRSLGRVARMNINRQQTLPRGTTAVPGLKVERLDTQLVISIYNLANVAARQTSSVSMACPDVETAYHAILSAVTDAGGRVVNSSLNRIKPE
jgi:hypothetical protein